MLISTTAVSLRVFCYKMFAIFIFIAHRNFDITTLLLTTFVCTHVFQRILIYSIMVVSSLFMNEFSLKILFKLLDTQAISLYFFFSFAFCII